MTALIERSHLANRGLSSFESNLRLPRHRWYPFKEGFSDALVGEAVDAVSRRGRIVRLLDPFCGSGTTLVTAGQRGIEATGIEVNPFLAFAARAKCVPGGWGKRAFDAQVEASARASHSEQQSPLEGLSTFTERPGADRWLFHLGVVRAFTSMERAIGAGHAFAGPLRLALIASAMECCNAKRDGKALRYRRAWRANAAGAKDLRESFLRAAEIIRSDGEDGDFASAGLTVLDGDARQLLGGLPPRAYDLLVTSPPYLNSFDYSDVYRPELFLGGFVRSNRDLREIRLRTIRSHVQVAWERTSVIASPLVPPLLDRLRRAQLWDSRIPDMVQAYFADMACVLNHSARLVRRGGQAWVVVSTSAYGGVDIPVDLIMADVATRNGWRLDGVFVLRQLRSSGQQWAALGKGRRPPLRESLVLLRR